jgi:lipid-A-disaccharide synthase
MRKIFIIAGEASGDLIGAEVMRFMPGAKFSGVGGEEMKRAGLASLFDIRGIAVMGLAEVLLRLPLILFRLWQTKRAIAREKPDMILTIDSPGFSFNIAKWARRHLAEVMTVHYVAPSVWAWKPRRARVVARLYDALLCFFPFEKPYFERYGLDTHVVGFRDMPRLRPKRRKAIAMLPGSRASTIKRLMPVYERVAEKFLDFDIEIPVVATSRKLVRKMAARWGRRVKIIEGRDERFASLASAEAALCVSGTAVLEAALLRTPCVVAYKFSPITYFIARRMVKIPLASLPNIILGREAVPEFIQGRATPENLAAALRRAIYDKAWRAKYAADCKALAPLARAPGTTPPGRRAADILTGMLAGRRRLETKRGS